MQHQGHTARIEFDERDSIFVGRVLGLRSSISFHGDTVAQLRNCAASWKRLLTTFCKTARRRAQGAGHQAREGCVRQVDAARAARGARRRYRGRAGVGQKPESVGD
jgi:hypothetical protein